MIKSAFIRIKKSSYNSTDFCFFLKIPFKNPLFAFSVAIVIPGTGVPHLMNFCPIGLTGVEGADEPCSRCGVKVELGKQTAEYFISGSLILGPVQRTLSRFSK